MLYPLRKVHSANAAPKNAGVFVIDFIGTIDPGALLMGIPHLR
jgi:hypothetical protein